MKVTNLNNYDYIIIVGLTGVGKSSLVQKMVSDYGMVIKKKYTTRPKRHNEDKKKYEAEYFKVTEKEMFELDKQGKLLSHISPKTAHGVWHYGIPIYEKVIKDDPHRAQIQVLGINDIQNIINIHGNSWFPENSLIITMYADISSICKKLQSRLDTEESIRRLLSDIQLFGEYPETGSVYQQIFNMRNSLKFPLIDIVNYDYELSTDQILSYLSKFEPINKNCHVILNYRDFHGLFYMWQHEYGWDLNPNDTKY